MISIKENKPEHVRCIERTDTKPVIMPFPWLPSVYRNMFNYSGRTGPTQFWVDIIFLGVGILIYQLVACIIQPTAATLKALAYVMAFILLTGFTSTAVRRARDAGYPAWTVAMIIFPIVGPLLVCWRLTRPSDYEKYQKSVVWYHKYEDKYYVDR